jgi:glycosyltransferase involved in cell wall biosynthesis
MIRVTIGVCTRNCGGYIGEAIDSILNQDFPHELIELIFVDESEDNTLSVIQYHLSKSDISSKVFHVFGKGLGYARNLVAAKALGEFIVWVDGDMTLPKDFVRKQVTFMENHPSIGIARAKQALEHGNCLLATLEGYSRAAGRMVDYQSEKARAKTLGTGGAIYRTRIILQVKGFDESIKGYGEDWDIEIRAKAVGWSLSMTDATYLDYERHGLTWRGLWRRYWRRGYDSHYFFHKYSGAIKHYRMFPPAAFLAGLIHARKLYKLKRESFVFLLPFQYLFKMTVWYFGFTRSHLDSYEYVNSTSNEKSFQSSARALNVDGAVVGT